MKGASCLTQMYFECKHLDNTIKIAEQSKSKLKVEVLK